MFNRSFDERLLDYGATYENTLHFSPRFQGFARSLAERLVASHDLVGARVGELGSGPGHFLSMLCEAGAAEGFGWDPSYDPDRLGAPDHRDVAISNDLFPDDGSVPVRLAFSQHVLEHLRDPVAALSAQRQAVVAHQGVVYSEVPNGQHMVQQCALWDLIYEHLSYFVPTSLELACRRAGLEVSQIGTTFGDQFLWCEATPGAGGPPPQHDAGAAVAEAVDAARRFGRVASERIESASADLGRRAADGPVALWGAGSKGLTYLNLMSDVAPISAVVDLNPRKAGAGVPGTSLVIDGPQALVAIQPRTVIVANPLYRDEIATTLADLGLEVELLLLWT